MVDTIEKELSNFSLSPNEGTDKVMSIQQAIKQFIRPNMTIDIGYSYGRPNAAIYEIVRQFHDKNPKFTIITAGLIANQAALVSCGMVKKIIASFCGDNYPTAGPNPVFQRAVNSGKVEIENWSLLSLNQRLLAGAMGVPFIPTNSLKDSGMEENSQFESLKNPFGEEDVGVVKAINPDVVLIHGLAADRNGNVILSPPYGEALYGAMASKKGVIVTVEKIVSTEVIRKNAAHVKIPGYLVKSVSETPFGAHPYGIYNPVIEGLESYTEDHDFIINVREKAKDDDTFNEWVQEWILKLNDFNGYIKKIGEKQLQSIKQKSEKTSWVEMLTPQFIEKSESLNYTDEEMMVVVAARKIKERMMDKNYQTILAGVGFANLAAWLSVKELKGENIDAELMSEIGMFGYYPQPGEPFIFSNRNLPTCKMFTDVISTLGIMVGGNNNPCLGSVGAGQIDRFGNINSTYTSGGKFMVGSGGANDIASSAQELVVTVKQSKNRFVDNVPYITSPGKNIKTVVSNLGVFQKSSNEQELILTGCFQKNSKTSLNELIDNIKEKCSWDLKVNHDIELITPPTLEELKTIRYYDPEGIFLK